MLKEREELQVVPGCLVSPVAPVSPAPAWAPVHPALWEIPVCLAWTENLVSKALPVPLVPPALAPLRETEATPDSQDSLEPRARKESPVTLEVPVSLAALASKESEGSPATAEVLV